MRQPSKLERRGLGGRCNTYLQPSDEEKYRLQDSLVLDMELTMLEPVMNFLKWGLLALQRGTFDKGRSIIRTRRSRPRETKRLLETSYEWARGSAVLPDVPECISKFCRLETMQGLVCIMLLTSTITWDS